MRTRFSARPDRPWDPPSFLYNEYLVFPGGKVWSGHAADHSPPSSAAVMEEYSYTSTHPLDHIGPVTGSLYLYLYYYVIHSPTSSTYFTVGVEAYCGIWSQAVTAKYWARECWDYRLDRSCEKGRSVTNSQGREEYLTGVLINPWPDQEANKIGSMAGTRAIPTTSRRELTWSSVFPCKARCRRKLAPFWHTN